MGEKKIDIKKTFSVRLPLNGVVMVEVEAENEKAAIDKALEECDLRLDSKSEKGYSLEEWTTEKRLMQGNVWYGICYEADAQSYD